MNVKSVAAYMYAECVECGKKHRHHRLDGKRNRKEKIIKIIFDDMRTPENFFHFCDILCVSVDSFFAAWSVYLWFKKRQTENNNKSHSDVDQAKQICLSRISRRSQNKNLTWNYDTLCERTICALYLSFAHHIQFNFGIKNIFLL